MQALTKVLAGALVALPLYGGAVGAAPLSQPSTLRTADIGSVEHVQYRHRYYRNRGSRWIGPAAGVAAGLAIGGAIASSVYNDGYYAYGAAPGYVEPGYAYGAVPRYRVPTYRTDSWIEATPQYGSCSGDRDDDSGYPSWACR